MSEQHDDIQAELKDLELSMNGLISENRLLIHENNLLRATVETLRGIDQPPDPTDEERDRRRDLDYAREFERSADYQARGER